MGRLESNLTISAEATLHRALADFAQAVYDDYGVQICDVHIDWRSARALGEQKAVVAGVEMDTMSRGRREEGGS